MGKYKQLSGCIYLVSIKDVMNIERKLESKGLLRLFTSTSKGVLTVSDFKALCSANKTDKQFYSIISLLRYGYINYY